MKTDVVKKVNTLGNAGHIICVIGKVVTGIVAVCCLACAILMCFIPKETLKVELKSTNSATVHFSEEFDFFNLIDMGDTEGVLKVGDHSYKIVEDNGEPMTSTFTFDLFRIKWILFMSVVVCGMAFAVFTFAGKLCRCFKNCETPFTDEAAQCITKLAWGTSAMYLLSVLTGAVSNFVLLGNFDITLDLSVVLIILCVFMLSYIFKCGVALQKESDETL